jgi:hypothetical protein
MARNNIYRVPPPTSWGRELLVGYKAAGAKDLESFETIADALAYIESLPAEEQPSLTNTFMLRLHPSAFAENVWLPDYVGIIGIAPLGSIITGDPSHRDKPTISIGIGYISNVTIFTGDIQAAGIFIRNANSGYTIIESEFGSIGAGDTLIVDHNLITNTITFAGTETDADDVAAAITAQGTNIKGINRYGRVEIRPAGTPPADAALTVKSTGTANAALGFSTVSDTTYESPSLEIMLTDNVIISNCTDGILQTDLGLGNYVATRLIIIGNTDGIHVESYGKINFTDAVMFFNGYGIRLEDNANISMYGGFSRYSFQYDIVLEGSGSILDARSFAYATRSGVTGKIIPAGSRLTYEFNIAGQLSVASDVDGLRLVPCDSTIEGICMVRQLAGNDGQTIIDVNYYRNGIKNTLYTTQGNRPSIPANAGDYEHLIATLPDIINLQSGDLLSIDIDDVDNPKPDGLNIVITAVVN